MVDVTINSGATIGVSATLPATFDADGYATPVITDIGEVIDIGELAKAWSLATHQSVSRRYPQKLKDVYDIGDVSLTIGRVFANAGQVLLQAAEASDASYTFEIVLPSGDVAYFTGKVTKIGIGGIATGGVSQTVVTIAVDPESLYEA